MSYNSFLHIASDKKPNGYYTIANSFDPTDLFIELEKIGVFYQHDTYNNFIQIFCDDIEQASNVRKLVLDEDLFFADDIDESYFPLTVDDKLQIKIA